MQAEYGNQPRATGVAPLATTHPRLWRRFTQRYEHLLTLSRRTRRALVRRWGLSLAGIALALTLGLAGPTAAAPTATINIDGVTCTLADAITAANTDAAAGGCAAGSGDDTLALSANITLATNSPQVTSNIALEGNGYTIDGANAYRALDIAAGTVVSINNVTLSNNSSSSNGGAIDNDGDLTITNSTLSDNSAANFGGAINNFNGDLTITNSTLSGNSASYAGAIVNGGELTITDSILSNNSADYAGGAIYHYAGNLTISNSTLSGNAAGSSYNGGAIYSRSGSYVAITNNSILSGNSANYGGVIHTSGGTVTITDSTLNANTAAYAGAIYNAGGTVTITNSEISDNSATDDGGAIYNRGDLTIADSTFNNNATDLGFNQGGAILNTSGSNLTITNSTFSDNATGYGGGAISNYAYLSITDSTFSGNSAYYGGAIYNRSGSYATIDNSTFSGNSAEYEGGAIYNSSYLNLTNTTFSGNSALDEGGAINSYGYLDITSSTFTGNSAYYGGAIYNQVELTIVNSVISGNSATNSGPELYNETGGTVTANAYNVIGQNGDAGSVNFTPGANDIVPAGPASSVLNLTLGDNGGPTLTHDLVAGSPAIDIAPTGPAKDQRGADRPYSSGGRAGAFDAGSVEYNAPLAIELATLTANPLPSGGVRVTWETASEIDSAGFNLLRGRSADGSDKVAVNGGLIAATGSNGLGDLYSFDDTTAGVGTHYYWLEEIDTRGVRTLHGPVSAEVRVPTAVTLAASGAAGYVDWITGALAALLLLVTALFAFLRRVTTKVVTTNVRRNDFSRYTPPTVTTLADDELAANLGAARAFSTRGWDAEDEL